MVGAAVGDALGGPLEFMTAEQIKTKHGEVTDYLGGGWLALEPGAWTDDSQVALITANLLIAKAGFHGDHLAAGLLKWMVKGPVDIGGTTACSLGRYAAGLHWTVCGVADEMSQANGCLMGVHPIALAYDGTGMAPNLAAQAAAITHRHINCQAAVAELAQALGQLLAGGHVVLTTSRAKPDSIGYVWTTYDTAVRACAAPDFETGMIRVINQGGDADTNGAVAGALLGAQFGVNGIPRRWRDGLQDLAAFVGAGKKLEALNCLIKSKGV